MSDPRENCPWKCKHCLCYDGKIRELTESCELAMTERNKQADMAQELLAKNTRLTKENERLRDDLKRIEAAHRRDLAEYNRVSIELTRLKSALTEIAFDEWVSDEAVTIAKDALDQP